MGGYLYHFRRNLVLAFCGALAVLAPVSTLEAKGPKSGGRAKAAPAKPALRTPVMAPAKTGGDPKVIVLPPGVKPTLDTALKKLPTGQASPLLTCPDPFTGYKRPLMMSGGGGGGGSGGGKGGPNGEQKSASNGGAHGNPTPGSGNAPRPDASHLMTWDGCAKDSPVQGGYIDRDDTQTGQAEFGKCGKDKIDPQFFTHMQKTILPCATEAAEAAGIGKPKSVFVTHMGVFNQRQIAGTGSWSQHSYGRAIDIAALTMKTDKYPNGYKMSAHVQAYKDPVNAKMYDKFVQCFSRETMKVTKGCGGEGRGVITHTACKHLGFYNNGDHHNHIHASLDICAGNPYEVPSS